MIVRNAVQLRHIVRQASSTAPSRLFGMEEGRRVRVDVRQGSLLGQEHRFDDGRPFVAFKGVPYAQPPVGPLRFQPPVPIERYPDEVTECLTEGSQCIHRDPLAAQVDGSEDCLYLNVYTPNVDLQKSAKKLPIMVWIHGGGFTMDSGSERLYSPEYLIEKDVIVVTINYRIGPFGFLSLPQAGIAGNAGLKDQLQALRWIQENADSFGGDPNNVTLFGQSAGAGCVHLHLLNAESRQYFQRAICQSGTSILDFIVQNDPVERAIKLAKQVGGVTLRTNQDFGEALMNAKDTDLIKKSTKVITLADQRQCLFMPFRPVVEAESEHAIVTKKPVEVLQNFNNDTHPVMMGYNSEEGLIFLIDIPKRQDEYMNDKGRIVPPTLNITEPSVEFDNVAAEMRKFYFQDRPISMETAIPLTTLLGDYHFIMGIQRTAELHTRTQSKAPFYAYRFSYDGDLNLQKMIYRLGKFKGACHGDEMFHLFKPKIMDLEPERNSPSRAVREQMCRLWTDFAKHGKPSPVWEPLKVNAGTDVDPTLDVLSISDKLEMVTNPDEGRTKFWRALYKRYNGDFLKPKL